jgi:FlaA1/EpsC-like NDP-sugar epimerase
MLTNKTIVVTGGTGSLGQTLVRRLLSGELGMPKRIIVLSRDEAKQHYMRLAFQRKTVATDEVIYRGFESILQFQIGDVCDENAVLAALREAHVVFHAAALKQVPTCEYFPSEAVRTNVGGAETIVRTIQRHRLPVETVVGMSTDKACKPVSVMGMTKALQERVLIRANLDCPGTRFIVVRYGNVLASRGSVVPLFLEQARSGGPLSVTDESMTRFLLSLDHSSDTIFTALRHARPGEVYVPHIPAARVLDIARAIVGTRPIPIVIVGSRPGEKTHEILVSEEEAHRTYLRHGHYVIEPLLPELRAEGVHGELPIGREFSSFHSLMSFADLQTLFERHGLLTQGNESVTPDILA